MSKPSQDQRRYQSLSELEKIPKRVRRYQDSREIVYQERVWLDEYQYKLYKAAMYGLSAYSSHQLYKMSYIEKQRISRFYVRAQKVLNLWKQQLINQLFEQLCSIQLSKFPKNPFETVFGETKIGVREFGKRTDEMFECTITFEQLKINRKQIIKKLITEKIFPENFFQLNTTR